MGYQKKKLLMLLKILSESWIIRNFLLKKKFLAVKKIKFSKISLYLFFVLFLR